MTDIVKGFPSTMMDNYQLSMGKLIAQAARSFPEVEIVHRKNNGEWGRTTYGENFERIKRSVAALRKIGVDVGDRVGVMDWNSLRHFELYWSVPAAGAVFTQLNLRLGAEDLSYVINETQAKAIFVDESLVSLIEPFAEKLQGVQQWVILSEGHIEHNLPNAVYYEDLLAEVEPSEPEEWPNMDETSAFAAGFTTGTTGRPKGVFYSHRSGYLHAYAISVALSLGHDDAVMPITPMFHVLTWGFIQATVLSGAKLVLPGMFSAETIGDIADAIEEEHVTISNGIPSIFTPLHQVLKAKGVKDLSYMRLVSGGAEPPNSLINGFQDDFNATFIHAYGATETSPVVTYNRLTPPQRASMSEQEQRDIASRQGRPTPNVDIRVVDGMGNEVPHDGEASGELLIRSPWVTGSYYGMPPEELAEKFVDGYWRSGDVGTVDEHGFVKITDRLKDVIKSGGEWISSIDLENLMVAHPKVQQAAVVGLAHPKWQERPFLLLVLADGEGITKEEIDEHLLTRFAKWQLPEEFKVVEEIPATSVGKIDKKRIRAEYADLYQ